MTDPLSQAVARLVRKAKKRSPICPFCFCLRERRLLLAALESNRGMALPERLVASATCWLPKACSAVATMDGPVGGDAAPAPAGPAREARHG